MVNPDTLRLLRECDAGIKMGVLAIDEVMDNAQDKALRALLASNRAEHEKLLKSIQAALQRFEDAGKDPPALAKTMSAFKTNVEMLIKPTDTTIASLIIDGCGMGIKSLSKYLNQYAAADEDSKDLCKKLIAVEEQFAKALRAYL